MLSLTSLFLRLVIGTLQQGLGLFKSGSIGNYYLEVTGTIVTDPAHIASEAFFQFHGIRAKLQVQNDFVPIYLNASKILRFLICKVEFQLIAGHVTERFDKVANIFVQCVHFGRAGGNLFDMCLDSTTIRF